MSDYGIRHDAAKLIRTPLPALRDSQTTLFLRVHPADRHLEAIARALGILERRDVQTQLETLRVIMVERTLWSRGTVAANECTAAGIPREAL
jgi:hypothetical protein